MKGKAKRDLFIAGKPACSDENVCKLEDEYKEMQEEMQEELLEEIKQWELVNQILNNDSVLVMTAYNKLKDLIDKLDDGTKRLIEEIKKQDIESSN